MYKYTTKQEEFGKKHDNDITIGATVLVLCNSGKIMTPNCFDGIDIMHNFTVRTSASHT